MGRADNAEMLRKVREADLKIAAENAKAILADPFLTTEQRISTTQLLTAIAGKMQEIQKERDYWTIHRRRKKKTKAGARPPKTTVRVAE